MTEYRNPPTEQLKDQAFGSSPDDRLEQRDYKPKGEGINNTDLPGIPIEKQAKNNPSGQNEGLSGGGEPMTQT
jgi:hypothetical protein